MTILNQEIVDSSPLFHYEHTRHHGIKIEVQIMSYIRIDATGSAQSTTNRLLQ